MEITFNEIEKEFKETFGYVRQDIDAILTKNLGLNYTIALLVCCACEMLTWHQRHCGKPFAMASFTSFDRPPYKLGATSGASQFRRNRDRI